MLGMQQQPRWLKFFFTVAAAVFQKLRPHWYIFIQLRTVPSTERLFIRDDTTVEECGAGERNFRLYHGQML